MQLKVGDRLPDLDLKEGPEKEVNLRKLAANKKIIVLTVNGAFLECCSKDHLQGYIDNYEKFKAKGIDEILVVSGNDPYVMQAWADQLDVKDKPFRFLADYQGQFCKRTGLVLDEKEKFGTLRCKRACMYVDDALVEKLCIEPDGKSVTCSKAETCLEKCC